ncbi:MAG: LysM peptidoglycan-binding domain-containing protein [Chloroflexi bacterium]|nr:LysM peptidoglycan-binding domain-containing protein [Chloroflexota bacterium]
MRPSKLFFISLALILSLIFYSPVTAQDGGQDQPYYIVQEGDSLWQIAARFGVSLQDLQQANNISDAGQVSIGAQLVIPGLKGIGGRLDTITVNYGESLRALSRRYDLSESALAQANRLVSPAELFAGATLIVPFVENPNPTLAGRADLTSGQSLLELAVLRGEDPWSLIMENNLQDTWSAVPGDVLRVAGSSSADAPAGLPEAVTKVEVDPLRMIQGGTEVIKVYAPPGAALRGSLAGRNLNFFPQEYGYVALQGIHALTTPGLYPLTLEGELPNGESFAFSQNVLIGDANFPYDPSLNVDPATLDPAVTGPESKLWASLGAPVSPEKMWNGLFASPVPAEFTNCWTSLFGNRRSYNGGTYDFFHSGLDFCGQVGTELYAAAPGKVTYTNFLTVRGGVVVIDHGWGVYTAYDHLSKILVQPGDTVQPGQLVGLGGATGRTTGPHLHWEVWVGGVQVNPVDWMQRAFP